MAIQFPQADLPVGVRGGSALFDGAAEELLFADFYADEVLYKVSSDGAVLSIAESLSLAGASTRSDSVVFSITETTSKGDPSQFSSPTWGAAIGTWGDNSGTWNLEVATRADSAALSFTEVGVAVFSGVMVSSGDVAALTITEGRTLSATSTRTDTLALAQVESAIVGASSTRADTLSLGLSETSAIYVPTVGADTGNFAVTESGTVSVMLASGEAAELSFAESGGLAATSVRSDTLALTFSEDAYVLKAVGASDSLAVLLTEASSIHVPISLAENINLSVLESGGVAARSTLGDSGTISLAETAEILVVVSGADILGCGLDGSGWITIGVWGNDTAGLTIAEVWQVIADDWPEAAPITPISWPKEPSAAGGWVRDGGASSSWSTVSPLATPVWAEDAPATHTDWIK